jgi:hypothetical protein
MKPCFRLCHVGRVFSTVGITMLILTGVAAMLLSPPPIAHADGGCPPGEFSDPDKPGNCLPISPGRCGSASHYDSGQRLCILNEGVSFGQCPPGTRPNPDNPRLCTKRPCGSASRVDSKKEICILKKKKPCARDTFPDPDNPGNCIPNSRRCGSASSFDPEQEMCILKEDFSWGECPPGTRLNPDNPRLCIRTENGA